ncbi:uncharacterized protein LOC134271456 [Saccostrea cucullata]|uniref:uncharacterized protein LOC134271456 n=1 Tax=Saccostrea cuccullata TaxID=36930 RepID=UPI002ED57BAF
MSLSIQCIVFYLVLSVVCCVSIEKLDGKVASLEAKLETLSATVLRLSSQNDHLKMKVQTMENIIMNCKGCNGGEEDNTRREHEEVVGESWNLRDDGPTANGKRELGSDGKMVPESRDDYPEKLVRKRIVPPTSLPTELIAFHAYISKDSSGSLPAHHILKFDVVPLNKGNGYNAYDGIFVVPTSGTYVFTWAIMSDTHGWLNSRLMKNAHTIGSRYADSASSSVWDFSTGTVVADANKGDHVYVQLGADSGGKVKSLSSSRTSFSGWSLHCYNK